MPLQFDFAKLVNETMIQAELKKYSSNKSCGVDNVFYESILFGGSITLKTLTVIFRAMFSFVHVPQKMKRAAITLYNEEGGGG